MITLIYSYMDSVGYLLEGCILLWILWKSLCSQLPKKAWVFIALSASIYATVIYALNPSPYSVKITLIRLILLTGLSFTISINNLSLRILAVSFTVFFMETLSVLAQFISVYTMDITADLQIRLILLQILPDVRLVYWIIYLFFMIIVSAFLRNLFVKMQEMRAVFRYLGFGFITTVNLLIELILMMIVYRSVIFSRATVILLMVFMTLSVIVLLVAFTYISTVQQVRMEQQIILSTNQTMSDGYKDLADKNDELRRMSHDLKHHLLALQNMEPEAIQDYITKLLQHTAEANQHIHSGDRYVDAVLNSRWKRMGDQQIRFQHHVAVPDALPFSAADICAIVSNQLDNAIEACEKIKEEQDRWILYEIGQHGKMWFFRCENSIVPGSLHAGEALLTSKKDKEHHGIGLKSLKAVAEHNFGTLQYQIQQDRFISVVSVTNTQT